jgi:hypothetical protein
MMGLEEEKELISFFVFDTQYSIIPTFHQYIGPLFQYSSCGEANFRMVRNSFQNMEGEFGHQTRKH